MVLLCSNQNLNKTPLNTVHSSLLVVSVLVCGHHLSMQHFNSQIPSILSIPSDVIQHHLIRWLSRADLVILAMTCKSMQKIYVKWLLRLSQQKSQLQSDVLDDIFRWGSYSQLIWYQENLKYLLMKGLNDKKKILIAANGEQIFFFLRTF